jgi:hypothetical protein
LAALVDVDVLDRDLLCALAAVAVEGVEQHGIGTRKFVGLGQAFAMALEGLFVDHRSSVALHCSIVRG